MPVNILYIINLLSDGGTEKQLLQLMHGLRESRFCPHLCTLRTSENHFEMLDIPKIGLQFNSFLHGSTIFQMMRLSKFIQLHHIKIVQTFFQDPFLLAALIKPFHTYKLIGSFRDMGFWRNRRETIKMRLAYPFYQGFIANSQAVKEHFARVDGLAPNKITVIHNGIDLHALPHSPSQRKTDSPPLVGIVANLNRKVKRVQDFISAAAIVHRYRPDVRFLIVGDGWLRPQLEAQAEEEGLGVIVHFTGLLPDPMVHVRNFSVGVITSESEGLCNAIIEYIACGVPVVATAAGGNFELIEEGENGFLVPVGAVEKIAERIVELIENENLSRKMSKRAKEKVVAEFSLQHMIRSHLDYYENILR
jgi:L-malate glycosyltransferase